MNVQSRKILEAIADGHSYGQILQADSSLTYKDIFQAAADALESLDHPSDKSYEQRMAEIHKAYPRAYEKWSMEEDATLAELFRNGTKIKDIAKEHQRQPSAIRSRLIKLNLIKPKQ